jgi:hypothetical protein
MIPIPSPFRIRLLKALIQWLMDGLIETVFTTEIPGADQRHEVSCIEDAYHALEDALEALEDTKWQTPQAINWWHLKRYPK